MNALVDQGDSVIIIEHNMEVIKSSDWIIDLGPEGGVKGGEIIAEGTPEQVAQNPRSHTGHYLKAVLEKAEKVDIIPTAKVKKPKRQRELV